jgi:hypothetical protein
VSRFCGVAPTKLDSDPLSDPVATALADDEAEHQVRVAVGCTMRRAIVELAGRVAAASEGALDGGRAGLLNNLDQHHNHGEYQQNMDKAAQCESADEAYQPQQH